MPTGIDRVCLEYVDHFGPRAQAVVQFKGSMFVLSPADSDRLFAIVRNQGQGSRASLLAAAPAAWATARRQPPRPGMIYLNVGHTGLHERALPEWIAENGLRAVYLVHDLIPITHPQFCRGGEADKHALRMENALNSAAGIIGNSQATLDDLAGFASARHLPMPPGRAIWISGGPAGGEVRPRRLERPHFVTVGTIEGRKNHLLLLTVWRRLVAEMGCDTPLLIVIGQRGWEAEDVTEVLDGATELRAHVRELGHCDDSELAALTAGARALLMPSWAEGFGLPVIEALQLGTPVIAAPLSVYREIVGDIPTYVEPSDLVGWQNAIRAFTGEDAERERQLRAIASFRAPDWPTHFAAADRWLAELAAGDGSLPVAEV